MKKGIRSILLVACLLILLCIPLAVKMPYMLHICIFSFYMGSASLAWSVLGGLTGQTSLGHAAFMGLGAYMTTILIMKAGISPWAGMVIVFFAIGLMSVIMFYPCFILRGPYFTLVTIAFGETFRNLFTNWGFVGKGQGLLLPGGKNSLALMRFTSSKVPYYYLALVMFLLCYLAVVLLNRSKLGYALKTVREDEDTANAIGISPMKYKLIAAFISAGMMAVCGTFYANYYRYIEPDIMMNTYSVEFVLPAVIGGIGNVSGPVLGALILTPLSEYLRANLSSIIPGANLLIYAVILIAVIRFQPKGILGWYETSNLKKKVDRALDAADRKLFGGEKSVKSSGN